MKEYTYEGRQVDHFNISDIPFETLKAIMENEAENESAEAQELVNLAELELDRRCDLLGMQWEMLDDNLEIN